jgi:hypothetical protein
MSSFRFRFRTVLIAIAALAVLLGAIRFLARHFGVALTSIRIDGSNLVIWLDLQPGKWDADVPGPGNLTIYHDVYFVIPLTAILVLIALITVLTALASYVRLKLRKTRNS